MSPTRPTVRLVAVVVGASLVLAALSTVALGAAFGAFRSPRSAPNGQCSAPALAGTVVDVRLVDMMMMGGRVRVSRNQVPAETVSLRVVNTGSLVHELVVLPLRHGRHAGQRSVGTDRRVNETGSVGEASRTCHAGAGDGIDPGAIGWVTLRLAPGNYELICNLPGHYAAGMHTALHVR